jgi:hypothetical protein
MAQAHPSDWANSKSYPAEPSAGLLPDPPPISTKQIRHPTGCRGIESTYCLILVQHEVLRNQKDRPMKTMHQIISKRRSQTREGIAQRLAQGQPLGQRDAEELLRLASRHQGEMAYERVSLYERETLPDRTLRDLGLWVLRGSAWLLPDLVADTMEEGCEELRVEQQVYGWIDAITRALLTLRWHLGLPSVPTMPPPRETVFEWADPASRRQDAQRKRRRELEEGDVDA